MKLLEIQLVNPARRHRCELCREIFICHLCTIDNTHILHEAAEKERYIFICIECANKKGWVAMMTVSGETFDNRAVLYNYKTGIIIQRIKLMGRPKGAAKWRNDFDISVLQKPRIKVI